MKELVKHIEVLLLSNDCVVVPHFGGFVTCNIPARYIAEESLFLPPIRTVGFNADLKNDDGLLVQSFARCYNISSDEARKMLEGHIRSLQQELWESGTCDLASIGTLSLDENNELLFSPCQAGTICPSFYGLDAIDFPMLKDEQTIGAQKAVSVPLSDKVTETEPASRKQNTAVEDTAYPASASGKEGEITIRLKKSWVQNIVACAAVVLLFFMFGPKAQNTGVNTNPSQAQFASLMSFAEPEVAQVAHKTAAKETSVVENAPPVVKEVPAVVKPSAVKKASAVKETKAMQPASAAKPSAQKVQQQQGYEGYAIVLASAISKKNAQHYVEELHKKGYANAQVFTRGRMTRVILTGYSTQGKAYSKMKQMSNEHAEFESAWVLHVD